MYEASWRSDHDTYWLVVSPSFSEMSPLAPGRIAYTGREPLCGAPELTYKSPCAANRVGVELRDRPLSSHRSWPSGSKDLTWLSPTVTISVRSPFSQTKGVDQPPASSFLTWCARQISRPCRASNAARNHSPTS